MIDLVAGIAGLRPANTAAASALAVPPYDVIKPGTPLEALLAARPDALTAVTLGRDPVDALNRLVAQGSLITDGEPCLYVTEQTWVGGGRRVGFFGAVAAEDYSTGRVRRHEKTFDDKVAGRIKLAQLTGYTMEPGFCLTTGAVGPICEQALAELPPLFELDSDFGGHNDLHGLHTRVVRLPAGSRLGVALLAAVNAGPLWIADGHHRYHAALRNRQDRTLIYITDGAEIQAYNRVIRGTVPFAAIKSRLALTPAEWATPDLHHFRIYHDGKAWDLPASTVPSDAVGSLDCSILERELYPLLGLDHSMIMDHDHFDYYPERDLPVMAEVVDQGRYDIAVALHPVQVKQLLAVADQGLADGGQTVMPEKSTFFAPKVLSGLIVLKHRVL